MATFLFRVNGGEVLAVSTSPTAFSGVSSLFSTVTNPTLPDGSDLSVAKIHVAGTVRNATAPEIANFAVAFTFDTNVEVKQEAQDLIDVDVRMRKVMQAIIIGLIDEINILRALHALSARTLSGAVTAIKNKISNEDVT